MSTLHGADELARRLKAMSDSPRNMSRTWSDEYVQVARPLIPFRTGKTRRSVHAGAIRSHGAEIIGSAIAVMIDTGTRPHGIEAGGRRLRFQDGNRTIFARKVDHPGTRAQPYRMRAALEALRRSRFGDIVTGLWNRAA